MDESEKVAKQRRCKNNIGSNGEILRTVVGKKQKWQWSETVRLDEGVF